MSERPLDPDAPFKSFQKRLERGELGIPALDSSNRRLYGLPSQVVQREAFIADRAALEDSFQGEGAAHQFDVVPTWHRHGKGAK